jgi:hypothetical protein
MIEDMMGREPSNWTDDTPITLEQACELIFHNAIRPSTLKAEAERGNLELEKIGRRFFTTPAAIARMREQCRVQEKRQGSGCDEKKNGGGHWLILDGTKQIRTGCTQQETEGAEQRLQEYLAEKHRPTNSLDPRSVPIAGRP